MRLSRFFAIALLSQTAFSPALAADWEWDGTRYLDDPGFLPYAGEIEGEFQYAYSANLYDFQSINDPYAAKRSYDRSDNDFLPTLTYGITDDIAVFARDDFGNNRNSETYSFPSFKFIPPETFLPVTIHGKASFRSLGAENPAFGAVWRVIDQRAAPVSFDLTGTYSPDIFKGESATLYQKGTIANGGQSGSIQAALLRESHFLTLRVYGAFAYSGRQNELTDGGGTDLREAPHPTYSAGVQGEARLLPWFALKGGVLASRAMRYDRLSISGPYDTSVTIKPNGQISPYAGISIPLLPQRLVAEFVYQHDFVNNESQISPGLDDFRYTKQESNEFTARVLVTFGAPRVAQPAAPPPPPPLAAPVPDSPSMYLVFFDWDRADLSARARQIVAAAAQASTHVQATRIEVNGYTDLSGTASYNRLLSVRRARSVQTELVRDGVSAGEISIHGYGPSNPLVPTAAGVREPQNRRVEIILR